MNSETFYFHIDGLTQTFSFVIEELNTQEIQFFSKLSHFVFKSFQMQNRMLIMAQMIVRSED